MSALLQFAAVLIVVACVVAAYFLRASNQRPRVRPPPRSNRSAPSYQESNALANMFVEAVALKDSEARWPGVLERLNPENDPHIRTLLLELRDLVGTDPRKALEAVERVCIASKREGAQPTRAALLEGAKSTVNAESQ